MVNNKKSVKMSDGNDIGLDELIDELRAANEEEIASDVKGLMDSISLKQSQENQEGSEVDLADLKKRLVDSKLSKLSKSIDVLLENENVLSKLRKEDYEKLLEKIDTQEGALEGIKRDLESLSDQSMISYAEYLYNDPKKRGFYDKFISSRRGKIIQDITLQVQEVGDVYYKVPLLGPLYEFIKSKSQ